MISGSKVEFRGTPWVFKIEFRFLTSVKKRGEFENVKFPVLILIFLANSTLASCELHRRFNDCKISLT